MDQSVYLLVSPPVFEMWTVSQGVRKCLVQSQFQLLLQKWKHAVLMDGGKLAKKAVLSKYICVYVYVYSVMSGSL